MHAPSPFKNILIIKSSILSESPLPEPSVLITKIIPHGPLNHHAGFFLPARSVFIRSLFPKKGSWNILCPAIISYYCRARERQRRKPRLLLRLSEGFLFRFAARTFPGVLFQLPPRFTREFSCISRISNIHAFFSKVFSPSMALYMIKPCP